MSGHTPGPWRSFRLVDAAGAPLRDEKAVEYVAECVARRPGADFFCVAQPGVGTPDVCHTGNGPTSAVNAARIVACVNALEGIDNPAAVKDAIAALRALARQVKLMHPAASSLMVPLVDDADDALAALEGRS